MFKKKSRPLVCNSLKLFSKNYLRTLENLLLLQIQNVSIILSEFK